MKNTLKSNCYHNTKRASSIRCPPHVHLQMDLKGVESMVVVVFQSVFYSEMY